MSSSVNSEIALLAIAPADGRYATQTSALRDYFSEFALIKYRLKVEIAYFIALAGIVPQLPALNPEQVDALNDIVEAFNVEEAAKVKAIEKTTNHDVKALEYYIKDQLSALGLGDYLEFVHFGLTSQDVNNTATPLMVKDALEQVIKPQLQAWLDTLLAQADEWWEIPMLARTHGQPASPTRLGKEWAVFAERVWKQWQQVQAVAHVGKFGGATGSFNAHYAAYPSIDWHQFGNDFLAGLGLVRGTYTTQIESYDHLAAQCQGVARINTILIDFSRDVWNYISVGYFGQRLKEGEVGSSAMPHKVNPIDFENAEGNLGIANALFQHFAEKLPISRLQRDLTDSTVLRNLGLPFAHTLIALKSLNKGMGKLQLNEAVLSQDLDNNAAVLAEAVQTILRREGYPQPYEALKALTRGHNQITLESIQEFVSTLPVGHNVKAELLDLTPHAYTGQVPEYPYQWRELA